MTPHFDNLTILRIAKNYYLDKMSQQEISEKEKIHRTQISRILKMARELGYVQIRIAPPRSDSTDALSEKIGKELNLQDVIISPAMAQQGDQDETFYFFAARYLEESLENSRNIGIGLGKTLYHVASQITPQKTHGDATFYSIIGSSGTDNPYLQASILVENFARPFHGSCQYNNFPICLSRALMSSLDQKRFEKQQANYQTLDTVVMSLGGAINVDYPYLEEFSLFGKEIDREKAFSRSHGNLLGHIFYDKGETLELPEDYIITSMDLKLLGKIPSVICIARGNRKVEAIISAARQGYFKTLVTDEPTAASIIQTLSSISIRRS